MNGKKVVEIKNLVKNYGTNGFCTTVLKGIDLEICKGDFIAVMGPSGSGKTTLLNILSTIDKPTQGQVILDGIDLGKVKNRELSKIRRDKIGFIFQGFNLISGLTALENVELPLIYRNVPAARRRELSVASLKKVGLENRMEHKPSEMSGGQQQRVAIARALAAAPPMILADEPTGNLDSASSKEIMQILRGLHEEGRTVILITHDNKIAESAKRVIRIMDGKVVSDTAVKKKKEKKGKGEVE